MSALAIEVDEVSAKIGGPVHTTNGLPAARSMRATSQSSLNNSPASPATSGSSPHTPKVESTKHELHCNYTAKGQ